MKPRKAEAILAFAVFAWHIQQEAQSAMIDIGHV